MSNEDRSHSRSGPGGTTGARAGVGGLRPDFPAHPAPAGPPETPAAAPLTGEPLPMEPGQEYVAKADHDAVIEQLVGERDAMKGDLQRIAADFENFKRRAKREREQASAAAETKLLGELLTVIDEMERALAHAEQAAETHPKITEGVRSVHGRLEAVVTAHGLERVDTSCPFDPNLHDAMMVQPTPGAAEGTIVQVLESGWKLGDRVLRHARVIVAGGD